jgi:DNA-binding response OmpR family regulator
MEKEFTIKKPFINDPALIYQEKKEIDFNEDDKVVLIVDDNLDVITYVSQILSKFYKVITAKNGKEGVEKAMKIIPDLIVSDVMMPEKSGIDLCNELKNYNQTSHIPIILLTAKLGEKDKLEGMKIGADDYITKPFDSEYLLTRIENLFKNRKKIISFYTHTFEGVSKTQEEKKNIEGEFLEKLKNLVIEKYNGNDVSIPEIAQELGFSRSSLYRKVKAVTGSSISHFVKRVRLNKAAKLLLENKLNISEAAYETGFNDLKHFRASFKEQFGTSPSKFKRTNIKNGIQL